LNTRAPIIWCLLAALLFGASTPLAKVLLEDLGPLFLAALLYLGAAFAVFPATLTGGSLQVALSKRNLGLLAGAILVGGVAGPVLLLAGLQRAPAGSVSLWLNLETVATALLAWVFFKEDMSRRTWIAVGLVTGGGVVLALPVEVASLEAAGLVAAACLCWGLDNNFTALIDGLTPEQSTFGKGLVAGLFNLALAASLADQPLVNSGSADSIFAALALGGLCYGVSISLYIRGAQQLGAARSQLLFSAAPFFGLVVSWGLLQEPILWSQMMAGLLMGGGLFLMIRANHSHLHSHQPMTHTHSHTHDDGHHDHHHDGLSPDHQHSHEHSHRAKVHDHDHRPDLHHRHDHDH
jgi:drug/metabolite transporter (DMT)-like permease